MQGCEFRWRSLPVDRWWHKPGGQETEQDQYVPILHIYIHMHIPTHIHVYIYIYICICIYICVYIYIYVDIYIYTEGVSFLWIEQTADRRCRSRCRSRKRNYYYYYYYTTIYYITTSLLLLLLSMVSRPIPKLAANAPPGARGVGALRTEALSGIDTEIRHA